MSNTSIIIHLVFRTKHSVPAIPIEQEREFYAYMYGVLKKRDCWVHRIGGMPDHVHLLFELHPAQSLSLLVRELKVSSGNWLKMHKELYPKFCGWGDEYYAYSCGVDAIPALKEYIMSQKEHHTRRSLRDELLQIVEKLGFSADSLTYFFRDKA